MMEAASHFYCEALSSLHILHLRHQLFQRDFFSTDILLHGAFSIAGRCEDILIFTHQLNSPFVLLMRDFRNFFNCYWNVFFRPLLELLLTLPAPCLKNNWKQWQKKNLEISYIDHRIVDLGEGSLSGRNRWERCTRGSCSLVRSSANTLTCFAPTFQQRFPSGRTVGEVA